MVALLAAICFSQVPDLAADKRLDGPVTYVTAGQQVSQVLSGLSTVRLTLSVADPVGEDIVALRLNGVPLREVLTRLCSELKLEWRAMEKGYQLYETHEREIDAAKELRLERAGRLRTWRNEHRERFKLPRPDFDELQRRLAEEHAEPMPDPNKNWAAYEERGRAIEGLRFDSDPSNWFASSVIAGINDEQLEQILDEGSMTFASTPNRLQQRLPRGIQADLDTWARRKNSSEYVAAARVRMVDSGQVKVSVNLTVHIVTRTSSSCR